MAYLGINNNPELNGLYYFSSLAMGEDISDKIEGSDFFLEKEKKTALKKYSLNESDIKDGRILIDKFMSRGVYVAIHDGTPFDGVYYFNHKRVGEREVRNFTNTFMSASEKIICDKFGITKEDVMDGGYLMSGEVKDYLKNRKKTPKVTEKKVVKAEEAAPVDVAVNEEVKPEEVSSTAPIETPIEVISKPKKAEKTVKAEDVKVADKKHFENLIREMINYVADKDVVEITMSSGEVYRVALRTFFYADNETTFENCARMDNEGNPHIKDFVVNNLIQTGKITKVTPSKIKYAEGFVSITNCDDAYGPTIVNCKNGEVEIQHTVKHIVLNCNQVVSIRGCDSFEEINMKKITEENYKLVYDFLKAELVNKK